MDLPCRSSRVTNSALLGDPFRDAPQNYESTAVDLKWGASLKLRYAGRPAVATERLTNDTAGWPTPIPLETSREGRNKCGHFRAAGFHGQIGGSDASAPCSPYEIPRNTWARCSMSAFKNFLFKERYNLQFRAETFNMPNHPVFDRPGFNNLGN